MIEEKKGGKGKTIAIVILTILLIGSLGYIAYDLYFYKYFKKEVKVEEKKETKKEKVEEIDINDSKTIDKLKLIIPHNDSGKDAYQSTKVTYKDISNDAILSSVGQLIYSNPEGYEIYGSLDTTVNKSDCIEESPNLHQSERGYECYVKNLKFSIDNWYAYKKETISEIVKSAFGNINYTDDDIDIYKYIGICNYKNGIYFCNYGGGDTGCAEIGKQSEFTKATKKDDKIYLYEKYILYTSEDVDDNGELTCKTNIYKYGDKSKLIAQNKEYKSNFSDTYDVDTQKTIKSQVFKDYEDQATIYKHTFKEDGTGNYIWISTEPTN